MTEIKYKDENINITTSIEEDGLTGSDLLEMFVGIMLNAGYMPSTVRDALEDSLEHINECIRIAYENNNNE